MLQAVEMEEVALTFGLGDLTGAPTVAASGWGGHNHVWRVDTGNGTFAIKETRRPLGDGIVVSVEIERAAIAGGVDAPVPVAATDGRWVVQHGDTSYRCHEWVHGRAKQNEEATAADAASMGAVVAGLHRLELAAARPEPATRFGREHWADLAARAPGSQWSTLVRRHLDDIVATEAAIPDVGEPRIGSHRDLNAHNVLFDGPRLVLVDWDAAGPAWPAHERAAYAVAWAHTRSGLLDLETGVGFLRGYADGGGLIDGSDPAALAWRLSGLVWWAEQNVQLALRGVGEQQELLATMLVQAVVDGRRDLRRHQQFLTEVIARL